MRPLYFVNSFGDSSSKRTKKENFYVKNLSDNIFQREKGNTCTLLIIFILKSFKKSKIPQIYYYDPQSARINGQSSLSESTPRRLTLGIVLNVAQHK